MSADQAGDRERTVDQRVDDLALLLAAEQDPVERVVLLCRAVNGLIGATLDDPIAMLGLLELVKADLRDEFFGEASPEEAPPRGEHGPRHGRRGKGRSGGKGRR
jgi:hypothetical protein